MIERRLSTYLKRLGFSPDTKGYCAVFLAAMLVLENPNILNFITKRMYPIVANKLLSTPTCVEKRIRYAIECAWLKADIDFVEKVFQYSIDINKGETYKSSIYCYVSRIFKIRTYF